MSDTPDETPAMPDDRQVMLASSNAFVIVTGALIRKGLITGAELAALLDAEIAVFEARGQKAAAQYTRLMAEAFQAADNHG